MFYFPNTAAILPATKKRWMPGAPEDLPAAPASALSVSVARGGAPPGMPAPARVAETPGVPVLPTYSPRLEMQPAPSAGMPGAASVPRDIDGAIAGPNVAPAREDVAVPALPGRTGGARPYNPVIAAEYDYVRGGPRNEDGTNKRNWKDILLNTVLGATKGAQATPHDSLGGMIGGAAAGGLGTAINPMAGREYTFAEAYQPRVEADQRRAKEQEDDAWQKQQRARAVDAAATSDAHARAQTEHVRVQDELARQDERRKQMLAESQAALNRSRQAAVETGKLQITERINPDTGEAEQVAIYPNGDVWAIGGSARSARQAASIQSREKIANETNQTRKDVAAGHDATSLQRTGMAQGGATARTRMNIDARAAGAPAKAGGATKRTATEADVRDFAAKMKITPAEARARFKAGGYEVR